MRPTLFSVGPLEFHSYTFMMAVAFVLAVLLAVRENYKLEHPYPITPAGGLWVYFGALVGSRLYWIIQYDEIKNFYLAVFFWQGGLVFFGGLIGGALGAVFYLWYKRVPMIPVADIVTPFLPLGHAIGRVGCFLNGCCWGAPTTMPWGVQYPKTSWGAFEQQVKDGLVDVHAKAAIPVHPTQIYEALGLVCIFFVMRFAYKRRKQPGTTALLYPLLYGLLRFGVEALRGDSIRPILGLTVSQLVALGMFLAAAGALAVLYFVRSRSSGFSVQDQG
jgi:phosphatidylglycerol---prolipoprotein diacylglyceryl transferase